jgi:hypothetical protein
MKLKKAKIEEIETNGYQLNFESVFNEAFENYKKIALYAGLLFFVFTVIVGVLSSLFVIYYYGMDALTEMLKPENLKPENFKGKSLLVFVVSQILISSLLSPLIAGLLKMAYCAERDEEFHLSTLFEYYKIVYFKELFIATLLIQLASTGITSAFNFSGIPLFGELISAFVSFFTFLAIPLIIFSDLKAIDAIKSSAILISKQPLVLLGLIVVAYLGSLVGFIGCCIGIFFTLPFMYSMYYAIYSQIVGFAIKDDV